MKTTVLQAVKERRVLCSWNNEPGREGIYKIITPRLKKAVSFGLDVLPSPEEIEDCFESSRAMEECGVFGLPFKQIYLKLPRIGAEQWNIHGTLSHLVGNHIGILAWEASHEELSEMGFTDLIDFSTYIRPPIVALGFMTQKSSRDWLTTAHPFLVRADWKHEVTFCQRYSIPLDPNDLLSVSSVMFAELCNIHLVCLISLLNTQGIEQVKNPLRSSIRLNDSALSRLAPENTHTVVKISTARRMVPDASQSRPGGAVRKKMRLHMRRAHVRRQHYGQGWKQTRLVFIPQTLVGYASEGKATHDYLVER